jgi:outer membrane protein
MINARAATLWRLSLLLFLLGGLAGTVLPGELVAQKPQVTLAEAIDRAIDRSPTYVQSTANLRNAEGGLKTTLGSFLPTLSLNSGASTRSQSQFDPTTQRLVEGSASSMNAGVSARLTVFEGGRRFSEWDRTQADILAAEAQMIDSRYGVVLQTQTSFFNALRQGELLEVQRARVARAEESLSNIRRQVQLGAATRSDTLRARLEVANARLAEIQAETALRGAEFALGRQVGEAGPVAPVAPAEMGRAPLPLTDDEIYQIAEQESPAVRAAQANRTAANAGASSSRAAYWPSLSLSSGYSWANNAVALADGNTSWNLGISASVPVFNGFAREENISRAEQSARVARYQEDDARLAARQNADAALQSLRTAELTAEIAGEAVVVATEDLRVVEQRYRLGVGTILDLITSQIAVEQAEADLVVARYDYVLARAELEALLGRTL